MKIAMITPGVLPVPAIRGGAVEVLIEELISGNEAYRKHQIDVYTVWDTPNEPKKYQYSKIIRVNPAFYIKIINKLGNEYYKKFHIKKWRTSFSRTVVKLLKKQKYDIVIVQNNLIAYRDIYEKTINKNNLVYVIHNNVNDGDENKVLIARLVAKTAKKVLAVSRYSLRNFLQVERTKNVDVLYNCVDVNYYQSFASESLRKKTRKKYNIKNDEFVFMFSGRVDVYKGVLELVQAFKKLNHPKTKLLIVGKSWFDESEKLDSYTQTIVETAEEIKNNVIFTGFVYPGNMPLMYQIADCLVIPSLWEEPFGVVALEGMISKLPIIATKSGGLVEILDESCSILIDKDINVVDKLTEAMRTMVENPDYSIKMGKTGYQKAMSRPEFHKDNYYKTFCEKTGI